MLARTGWVSTLKRQLKIPPTSDPKDSRFEYSKCPAYITTYFTRTVTSVKPTNMFRLALLLLGQRNAKKWLF